MRRAALLPTCLALACLSLAACGEGVPELRVLDVWSRPTVATAGAAHDPSVPGVVYVLIENTGGGDDRLLSVSTPVCERPEIHVTRRENGRMHMAPAEGGLPIPAGETLELKPGGLHIMLMEMTRGLARGEVVPLVLEFEHSAPVAVDCEVRGP